MKTQKHALQTQRTSCLALFSFWGLPKSETVPTCMVDNRRLRETPAARFAASRATPSVRQAGARTRVATTRQEPRPPARFDFLTFRRFDLLTF